MNEAAVNLSNLSFVIRDVTFCSITLGLTVPGTNINASTSGERIVVTSRHSIVLVVAVSFITRIFLREINEVETSRERTST
mgnify:FL=1